MKYRAISIISLIVTGCVLFEARADESVSAKLKSQAIEARIRQHRMGELIIRTRPGAQVRVEQLRHEFWFGTAISNSMAAEGYRRRMSAADLKKYKEVLAANFNCAVHENAFKWPNCERTADSGFDYSTAESIYNWCAAHEIPMRGHCIFWATDRRVQEWVRALDDEELRKVVRRRARDATSRFKGRIEEFDLNNELLFSSFYRRRLADGIIKEMADWAKEGNSDAVLYLNEQGALARGGHNADKYVQLIRKVLDQGVPIGGIGCQGHSREVFDPEKMQATLDRLGAFGLPIKITEYDCDSSDEALKARHLRRFYTICFAHPAVEGILMWGFWEGAHWKPRAALWKRNWSETPAAKAYRELVFDKWWTEQNGKADSSGRFRIRAFYGKYSVESAGKKRLVSLQKDKGTETVTFSF